ncbi:MAG: hypothetical protein RL434_1034 [Pseudomonadota bacterium]|jgi:hypothetical protein
MIRPRFTEPQARLFGALREAQDPIPEPELRRVVGRGNLHEVAAMVTCKLLLAGVRRRVRCRPGKPTTWMLTR